jgi:hypothetical protein
MAARELRDDPSRLRTGFGERRGCQRAWVAGDRLLEWVVTGS